MIKRALISVSDKKNIIEFAKQLSVLDIEILSTGGTSKVLRDANIPVRDISEITSFPEIMNGRVKTLHPKIHGGILGQRDKHHSTATEHGIHWIDLVVVNLYPFAEIIQKPDVEWSEVIENIDIGGPAMLRSAAKNMEWVGVVVDPEDYHLVLSELHTEKKLSMTMRKFLATKAFAHTAQYDALIYDYLIKNMGVASNTLPSEKFSKNLTLKYNKIFDLRYGENPHQAASAYQLQETPTGILSARQHQGKQLSYNNIADADSALACVREFIQPACVIVKHANPCGVAVAESIENAFHLAYQADSQSAFGGIIALNKICTQQLAEQITSLFFEVLIAPAYEQGALNILAKKTNLRVLELNADENRLSLGASNNHQEFKFIQGGLLLQDSDHCELSSTDLKIVTQLQPTQQEIQDLLFAWRVVKHIKSNAIVIAKNNATLGMGVGQVSRVDAVFLALHKAKDNLALKNDLTAKNNCDLMGAVLASDAFFPFRDSIDQLAHSGIRAVIQPGGSVRDEEVIAACHEHGIVMVFTGKRCFKH